MIAKKGLVDKYLEMTPSQLDAEAAEFDKEMIAAKARPLTAEEPAWWEKMRRQRGRPRKGQGPL
jgi:hypothetical protein